MVRTLLKSALREIRQSLGRYLAILAIIALGVGFFSGLRLCQPAMMATGIDYVTQYKLFDFQLMSTLGYTEEDVAAFAALDGVSGAWGSVYTDFLMEAGDEEVVITARALTEGVNDPELAAGRMPEAANECLGDARYFTEEDLGTQVAVSPNNDEDTLDLLAYDSYTLVGLMHSPYYLNYERGTSSIGSGSVTAFIYLPEEGFDFEAYYEIYLTIADPAEAWSDAYDDQIDGLTDQVEDLARERADQRYDDIYDDALAEIEDAEQEIADGWEEYRAEWADAEQELADAHQELLDGEQELADARQELEDGRAELEDAAQELADAPGQIADAEQELADGWTEYNDGVAEAEQEFADAEPELHDAEDEVADARIELEDLEEADVYVLTRNENTGYVCFENDTSIIAAISLVFPVFFFLVAALVCMTTMTRMVDEERTQIGVLKALGYSNGQIMSKYLFYSGSAAVIGSVTGYAAGSWFLPWVVWEIYGIMYGFAPLKYIFNPALALVAFGAALLCSMGATWLSCRAELRKAAAELIRPKSPKAGKRVFLEYIKPLWRRLSFLHKVSVRNVLRYRSRLIMMVLGIGGCTALLITGFGIRDSITSIVDDQFDEITLYDYSVTFQAPRTEENVADFLADCGWEEGLLVHSGSADVVADNGSRSVYLVISSTGSLDGYIDLHSGDTAIDYPGPGEVVVNTGLAENLGLAVGDTIQLRDEELGALTVTISGICDNYVSNYVYVAAETYQQQLGQVPDYKTLYLHAHEGADPYAEGSLLSDGVSVSRVTVNEATRTQVDDMLGRLDYIVIVIVLCAAALAFIVLYNLTNINITERIREIATIKVLGFYPNEVASYVFREIGILSVLGSLAGLLMGKALHAFVLAQVQIDAMYFPSWISPASYLVSVGLTLLFSAVIALGMRPRLGKVDMAESLKSIE